MKSFKVRLIPKNSTGIDTIIQANDQSEARRLAEMQYVGCTVMDISEVR